MRSRHLGRVFDLSIARGQAPAGTAGATGSLVVDADDASFDSVVSVFELVRFADLPASVRELRRILRPGGEMWVVEPIGRPGLAAAALSWVWSASPRTAGLQLGRDVPAAVREAGLWITDVERFDLPGAPWPMRRVVALRATWVLPGGGRGAKIGSDEEESR